MVSIIQTYLLNKLCAIRFLVLFMAKLLKTYAKTLRRFIFFDKKRNVLL
nr:MAG TPA: hypothetical protein [Caudoviricetes sp.]